MKNTKLNNKGFSLVELIVVIAIMAILVGVLAPSVLGQIDKAKQAKDKQAMDAVVSAYAIAWADQDLASKPAATSEGATLNAITFAGAGATAVAYTGTTATTDFATYVQQTVGYTTVAFESNEFAGQIPTVTLNTNTGKVTLEVKGTNTYSTNMYTVTK